MSLSGAQKLAVLLCKFKGSDIEQNPPDYYADLFARRGTGGLNDYWIDASLGAINLDGSDILGWKSLDQTRDEFIATHPARNDKVQGAIDAFGVDMSKYKCAVAIFNDDPGDAGSNGGVLAAPDNVNVTFLAHETGHMFGLAHSFDQSDRKLQDWSAPGEYYDNYDIMSAMNVDSFATERFGSAGPLVCATNLDAMDWMPEDRIWTPEPGGSSVSTIDLVALSHAEIPGPLCARLGGFYVEFRINDGWDKGLAGPRILIHTLNGSNAIIIARDLGSYIYDWQPGQSFGPPPVILAIDGGDTMSVISFDVQAKTARLRITHTARKPIFDGPTGMVLGGVEVDAGGWIIVGGHIVKVPPRSPMLKLLSRVALLSQAHDLLGESEFGRIAAPVFEDVEGLAKEGRKQIG